jgi:hypothetical protein
MTGRSIWSMGGVLEGVKIQKGGIDHVFDAQ